MNEPTPPRVLTIAGSDSGGGAGIEADLKTFTALRVYGMAAITSITAQNTVEVTAVYDLPPALVAEQINVVARDIGVDAAKTGMLSTADIIEAVADAIQANAISKLVVDPVMVAKGGQRLLQQSANDALRKRMLPLALIVTPNIPEAEALAGITITSLDDVREAARRIHALGPPYVLIKGGHLANTDKGLQPLVPALATDHLFDGAQFQEFHAPRIDTKNTHGTGCTFSAAIAAHLAKGFDPPEAIQRAKTYLTEAIRHSLNLGHGHGPLRHL